MGGHMPEKTQITTTFIQATRRDDGMTIPMAAMMKAAELVAEGAHILGRIEGSCGCQWVVEKLLGPDPAKYEQLSSWIPSWSVMETREAYVS
jgi:hypothetical protein